MDANAYTVDLISWINDVNDVNDVNDGNNPFIFSFECSVMSR